MEEVFEKKTTEGDMLPDYLMESEIKYKDVFNYANDGMYLSVYEDNRLKIIDVNNKALEMLGYTREEFLKLDTTALVPPDYVETYEIKKHKLLTNNQIVTESVYLTKLGEKIPVELSKNKLIIGGREVFLTISRDISERKKLLELRLEEERKARTRNIAKIMIVYTDVEGRITGLTPQYCRLLGYTEEELTGKRFIDISYDEDTARNWNKYTMLMNKEIDTYEIEKRYKRKDGQVIWCYVNASLITDENGEPVGALSYVQDITKQKMLEEQLKCSYKQIKMEHERFDRALEISKIMICNAGINGRLIKVQPGFCQLLGYKEEELLLLHFQDFTYPEDRQRDIELYKKLMNGEQDSIEYETRYIRKNGEIIWVYVNHTLVRDENGNPFNYLTFIMDITQSKKDADKLRKINEQLRSYIKENEKLMFELRRFRHNLLNLLYGVNGYVESNDFEGLKEYFRDISEQLKVILDESRFSIEKLKNLPVRGLLNAKLKIAGDLGITMQVHIEQDIKIDNNYIKSIDLCEVLGVFLDNAIEAAAAAVNKKVNVYIAESCEYISIIIENTFKERPNPVLINQGFTSKGEGRGLGLHISKRILSQYPHVLNNTFVHHHLFVQEIHILKKE